MAIFYSLYGAATVVLIAVVVNTDAAKDHRVFFVLLNVLVMIYICLFNRWFRNALLGWINTISRE